MLQLHPYFRHVHYSFFWQKKKEFSDIRHGLFYSHLFSCVHERFGKMETGVLKSERDRQIDEGFVQGLSQGEASICKILFRTSNLFSWAAPAGLSCSLKTNLLMSKRCSSFPSRTKIDIQHNMPGHHWRRMWRTMILKRNYARDFKDWKSCLFSPSFSSSSFSLCFVSFANTNTVCLYHKEPKIVPDKSGLTASLSSIIQTRQTLSLLYLVYL